MKVQKQSLLMQQIKNLQVHGVTSLNSKSGALLLKSKNTQYINIYTQNGNDTDIYFEYNGIKSINDLSTGNITISKDENNSIVVSDGTTTTNIITNVATKEWVYNQNYKGVDYSTQKLLAGWDYPIRIQYPGTAIPEQKYTPRAYKVIYDIDDGYPQITCNEPWTNYQFIQFICTYRNDTFHSFIPSDVINTRYLSGLMQSVYNRTTFISNAKILDIIIPGLGYDSIRLLLTKQTDNDTSPTTLKNVRSFEAIGTIEDFIASPLGNKPNACSTSFEQYSYSSVTMSYVKNVGETKYNTIIGNKVKEIDGTNGYLKWIYSEKQTYSQFEKLWDNQHLAFRKLSNLDIVCIYGYNPLNN